jgi:phosphinothricin acetyltransferase
MCGGVKVNSKINIRVASEQDAEELLEIYAPYVKNTAITFEYELPTVEEFKKRINSILIRYPYLVAESDGEIVGYAYANMFHERKAYDWAVETSIYVKKNKKRAGIGNILYNALEECLKKQNILNVNACIAYTPVEDVHLSNDSMKFHKKMGYRVVGEFYKCGYKFNHWYNMIWMEKHIGNHSCNPEKVRWFEEIRHGLES